MFKNDFLPICWCGVDGYTLDLSPTCAGFLVRPWSRVDGPGELLIAASTGLPIVVPVTATPRQFCQRLGFRVGRYHLAPVTRDGRRAGEVVAAMEITPAMVARARAPDVLGEAVAHLVVSLLGAVGVPLPPAAAVRSPAPAARSRTATEAATLDALEADAKPGGLPS